MLDCFPIKSILLGMNHRKSLKLSSLTDKEIKDVLELFDIDDDTDEEDENEDNLEEFTCGTEFLSKDCPDEEIDEVIGLSESALLSQICLGEKSVTILSPTTTIASSTPPSIKRQRSSLGIIHPNNKNDQNDSDGNNESLKPNFNFSTPPGPSRKRRIPIPKRTIFETSKSILESQPKVSTILVNDPNAFIGSALDINPKSNNFKKILWRQQNLVLDKSAISFSENDLGDLKNLDTPYKCFEYFLNDEIVTQITEQTNIYAAQKDIGTSFTTNNVEIRQFIGILFFMSVYHYPSIRSYWSEYAFKSIQNTMSRNRFDQIRNNLHFNDNSKIPDKNSEDFDPLYKIRPIIKHFNERFQTVPMPQHLCVDEQMCATKMKTFIRQYMPDKPHKWGVKLFVLCDSSGFCYNFEVYGGAGDNVVLAGTPDLGASSNVVIRLTRIVPEFKNHIIYFDNFYTSLALLVYLRSRGIYSLGTIRANRIHNCKLPTDIELKKHVRGYSTEFCGSAMNVDISLTVWKDNKAVRLASTYAGIKPFLNETTEKSTVSRFVRSEKKFVDIDCPNVINEYNKHMGGVDHMDSLIGRYKIPWKTSKYTNRLFTHLLDVAMVNAYILFHKINNPDPKEIQYQLPNFRSQVAQVLCTLQGTSKGRGRPRIPTQQSNSYKTYFPPADIRFDGIEHFPQFLPREGGKTSCKNTGCTSQTQVKCIKCNIHLCFSQKNNCFYNFHHK